MSDGGPNSGGNPNENTDTTSCTVVLPVYNERENLSPLLAEITDVLSSIEYEVVAVDDCSTDGSSEALSELAVRFPSAPRGQTAGPHGTERGVGRRI